MNEILFYLISTSLFLVIIKEAMGIFFVKKDLPFSFSLIVWIVFLAPEGWTVTAAIGNSTLTVTPPNQDGVEATITLQVHKGLHWAVDQIKVRSKKVITSWYQEFLAGAEIVVNDVTIKKGSADNKVVINGEEVDLSVDLIDTDNAEITADGLYFIEAGLNVTYKNSQNKNKVLINDSPTGEKPVVTCTNTITLNGTSLICKNVALKLNENATYRFLTINTNNAPYVAFDGCNFEVPSTATQNSFLNTSGKVMDNFSLPCSCTPSSLYLYVIVRMSSTSSFTKTPIFFVPGPTFFNT
jgi:hypothetical protein